MPRVPRTALVLGGGAARGAYETGVISYLREELPRMLGRPLPLDILSGTSIGAINACFLAASAHDPAIGSLPLEETWRSLELDRVLRFTTLDLMRTARNLIFPRSSGPDGKSDTREGGLVDPSGLTALIAERIPWDLIERNIGAGFVDALSITATHVATGRTTVFLQRHGENQTSGPWSANPHYRAVPANLRLSHAMASSAIPFLFPPVALEGELYVDGGLRQNVPISPAIKLGADRVIIISLRHHPGTPERESPPKNEAEVEGRERALPSAAFLAGKTLNALMLDRVDVDLAQLRRFNEILLAGGKAFGPEFETTLNTALLPGRTTPLRYIRNILIHPSEDIGRFAASYARSAEFARRAKGLAGHFVRHLADSEAPDQADLASYLLFDGAFAGMLIEMGREDARRREAEWLQFWDERPVENERAS